MKLALYRGKSLISLAIRWVTRSQYSHAAFVFDAATASAAIALVRDGVKFRHLVWISEGSVVEAWQGGVRSNPSISSLHTLGTWVDLFVFDPPLTTDQEKRLIQALVGQIGDPYDYKSVLRFITRRPAKEDDAWFCSELCFQDCRDIGAELLRRVEAWAVPPHWLQMSPRVKFEKSIITG